MFEQIGLYVVLFWLMCGGLCSYIASQKNKNAVLWLFVGVLFGIFGVIAIAAVPAEEDIFDKPVVSRSTDSTTPDGIYNKYKGR